MKRWFLEWSRRNVRFLANTLGICCFLEITFGLLEGTKPNYQFPWGRYHETLAVFGVILLLIGYITRKRPESPADGSSPAERSQTSNPAEPKKSSQQ